MPRRGTNRWSPKRERQYEHIKHGIEARGESAEAQRKGIEGRSKMTKKQLEQAVDR
jgi:plasmid stabilization system protein ParE